MNLTFTLHIPLMRVTLQEERPHRNVISFPLITHPDSSWFSNSLKQITTQKKKSFLPTRSADLCNKSTALKCLSSLIWLSFHNSQRFPPVSRSPSLSFLSLRPHAHTEQIASLQATDRSPLSPALRSRVDPGRAPTARSPTHPIVLGAAPTSTPALPHLLILSLSFFQQQGEEQGTVESVVLKTQTRVQTPGPAVRLGQVTVPLWVQSHFAK